LIRPLAIVSSPHNGRNDYLQRSCLPQYGNDFTAQNGGP
jgi:hypothetical protein